MIPATVILVIDDSIGVQSAVRDALAEAGIEVVCRGDAEAAEAWLDTNAPTVILCDVVLPGRNGYDLCRRVNAKAVGDAVPIFLLSSPFEPFDEAAADDCGARGVLRKPFTAAELRDRLAPFLAASSCTTARVLPLAPSESLDEVEAADVVESNGGKGALEDALATRLVEPLTERLEDPLLRRLVALWQEGQVPETVKCSIAEAAERLVRKRLQELESEESGERYLPEDAD